MAQREIQKSIDVQGQSCPLNAIRVKNEMRLLEPGQLLEVFIDEGEAVFRIARTLKDSGNKVVKVEPRAGGLRMIVQRSGLLQNDKPGC